MTRTEQLDELKQYEKYVGPCSFATDSLYTYLLVNISVDYFRLGNFVPAIQYAMRAIDQVQENIDRPTINKIGLAKIYYYLSIYYDSLKMVAEKNEAVDSCIANEVKRDMGYHFTSLLLTNRVKDLFYTGDYQLCARYSDFGESLIHKYYRYSDSVDYIVYFIYFKANSLFSMKRFEEADQYLQSKKMEFAKEKNKIYVSGIYSLLGYLNKTKKDYPSAIRYFQKALQYDLQTKDRSTAVEVLNQIGQIYAENDIQPQRALFSYFQSLKYVNQSDSFPILGSIANVYVKQKAFDSAFYYFRKAFNNIALGMDESKLVFKLKDYVNEHTAKDIIKLVIDKGDAYLASYDETKTKKDLLEALEIYRAADRLLDKIKSEQAEVLSQLFWQADIKTLYEHALKTCYLLNDPTEAFYFFEKSRASLLYAQLKQQSRSRNEDMLKTAQFKRKKLELERELDGISSSSERYLEIQKSLVAVTQSLDRLAQIIKKENPLYYQASFDTTTINISDTKKELLQDGQALLELFEGEDAVYFLIVTNGRTALTQINKKELDSTVQQFTKYVSNALLINSRQPEFIRTAKHLYDLIFKGIDPPEGRIIISPDGPYFPFEALVSLGGANSPHYFLFDHVISYTYSARYLMSEFARNESGASENFLGVAPVRYPSWEKLLGLAGSDQSLNQIGAYFRHSRLLIDDSASRKNFLRYFPAYRIIQLYTHSSDSSERHEPVIYFADSALYLSELIPENKPFTRLIVLSACETGKGAVYAGEGVFSFNRGFASLGIPAALTNLWAVENTSTYRLTESFYAYLAKGLPTDIALQKAKIDFIQSASKEKSLPYYWAATILAGKSEVLVSPDTAIWKYLLIGLAMTLPVFLIIRKQRAGRPHRQRKPGQEQENNFERKT